MFDNILLGLTTMVKWQNIIAMFVGTAGGIIIGGLPGLSCTMGIALLVPITFAMSPETGLLLIAGIFNGAIYGGSIAATLVRVPGTPAAIATTFDGYPMTLKGEADRALELGVTASTFGGIFSAITLLLLAPPLAEISLKFGPSEFFWLAVFGLSIVSTLTSGSLIKGLISACLGLFIGTVGMDPITARARYTFGSPNLLSGVGMLPMLIGLYSVPQVLNFAGTMIATSVQIGDDRGGRILRKPFQEFSKLWRTYVRSTIIGTIIGIIPAAGANIASLVGYNQAKRASTHPETFGTGEAEGVVGSEAANNAVTSAALIPLLALGIPGCPAAAVVLGGIMIHGLNVGPELFQRNPDVVYTFIMGMLVTNFIMLFMGFYGARTIFRNIPKVPRNVLGPIIAVLCIIGSFAIHNNMFDVYTMMIFGIIGYFMERYDYSLAPIVLAVILGPMAEANVRRAFEIHDSWLSALFGSPICIILFVISLISVTTGAITEYKGQKREKERLRQTDARACGY